MYRILGSEIVTGILLILKIIESIHQQTIYPDFLTNWIQLAWVDLSTNRIQDSDAISFIADIIMSRDSEMNEQTIISIKYYWLNKILK